MKRIPIILLLFLSAICGMARKSELVVSYDYSYTIFSGRILHADLILLTHKEQTKFYSQSTEFVDSLLSTPQGRETFQQMVIAANDSGDLKALPRKPITTYVLRSKKDNTVEHYDIIANDYLKYEEPLEGQDWEMEPDSTKTILGYECIKAVCNYNGRKWTAWFAPEIPVSDGPWKLCGLPGLILGAEDEQGKYAFNATGIKQEEREIHPVFGGDRYQSTERRNYLRLKWKFTQNPMGYTGIKGYDLTPSFEPDPTFDFLETDYR